MYQSPQKKSSSWTVTSIQKKSKSFSKPGSSAVQASRDANSAQSQDMPSYSTPGADLLTANIMRSVETEEHSEVEASTGKRQSEPGRAAVAATAPPIVSIPVVQPNSVGIQRQCSECAEKQQQPLEEEGKDVDEMSGAASGIQTKLTVGAPGDVYEQEADRVAAQVMSMPVAAAAGPQVQRFGAEPSPVQMYSSLAQSITPVVQRRVDQQVQMYSLVQRAFQAGGNQASGDLESRLNASKGGGNALAPEVRAFMEPRFGADFSGVRVHTGGEAVQMNQELGAQAFAHGSDIYFGAGKSPGNNELTAHELTHVVQQTGGQVQRKLNQNFIEQTDLAQKIAPAESQSVQRQGGNSACRGTNRRAGIEHETIQQDYIATKDPTGVREYSIPGGSASGAVGYADLVGLGTHAIYEIKPYSPNNITAGLAQVNRYLQAARTNCDPNASWHLGFAYADTVLPLGSNTELVAKQYNNPGLILYYRRRRRSPQPEINWETVFQVVVGLGLSIATVAVVLYALLSPEPATKLAAAGLSAAMITIILSHFGINDSNNQV